MLSLTGTTNTARSLSNEMAGVCRKHHLLQKIKLPGQKVALSSIENKRQLIQTICEELAQDRFYHLQSTGKHKQVGTGKGSVPY